MEMEEAKMDIFTNSVRDYPRSNAGPGRPGRQKCAGSGYAGPEGGQSRARSGGYARKGSAKKKTAFPATFKERIVFQATICGGFLAVLLFFNIIDSGFTNNVTGWIYRNISFDMPAEEGGLGGWVDSVMGIFGNDGNDLEDALPNYGILYDGGEAGAIPVRAEPLPQVNTVDSSRIDEGILREIEAMGE